ncbi:penicillin-binding protein 2 [Paraferrimonas sedimenticola]|nr:penicillin-binding protein 2 [Paraferrimonas sedimenticola]
MQDHALEAALFRRRALFCFACVVLMISVLVVNLYQLQVVAHKDYQTRSKDNRTRVIPTAPNRGLIFDRNGILIAENRPAFSLQMIPEKVKDSAVALDNLAELMELDAEHIEELKERLKRHRRFKPLTVISQLDEAQVALFSVNQHRFTGFSVEAGLKRHYPYAEELTHLLGYVGRINARDTQNLELADKMGQYAATNDIGKLGIERYYEDQLHGIPGYRKEEVNNRGRIIQTIEEQAPVAGDDLYLSVDLKLQESAIELLDGRRGAVVAIDPKDGGILAMVSSPSYDPNQFVHGISGPAYRELLNSLDRPLINRATQGQYAPASTVKPHLGLAGLEHEIITENTKIWDPGWWQIPGVERRYRDWKKWGHGWVDLHHSVAESCDTYFYDLAYKMGIDKISQFMLPFGFGESTGIDIHEEYYGILPSRDWKRIKYNQPWYIGDTISIGIGQGYWTATPLQMAQSVAIIANRGERIPPHLLKESRQGDEVTEYEVEPLPPIELKDEANWDIIAKSMYLTAHRLNGSGYNLFKDSPYKAAVKSGTGQVFGIAEDAKYKAEEVDERLRDNALFVGYAPYEDPKIVVAVIVENAGWGAANAGPVAKAVMDAYLLDPNTGELK